MTSHDNPANRGMLWRGGVNWVKEKAESIPFMCLSTSQLAPQVQFVLWVFFIVTKLFFLKNIWCVWLSVVLFWK